jgi:ribosome-binding factor A
MARSYRKERLNESLKELLGELVLTQIKDPRVGLVTITDVDVARDLETAKVYYTVMGDDEQRAASRKGLISAKNFLRQAVGRELKMRNTPDLLFVYDDSLDRSIGIEEAIKKIQDEEGQAEDPAKSDDSTQQQDLSD